MTAKACDRRARAHFGIGAAIFAVLVIATPVVSRAQAAAASAWPMYGHDAMHTCVSSVDTSANPGTLKWRFGVRGVGGPRSGDGLASPTIGPDGTIYFGTRDGRLFAIAADGKKKWVFKVRSSTSRTPAVDPQVSESRPRRDPFLNEIYFPPAIGADGTIYFGDYNGRVYALTPDGKVKWSLTLDAAPSNSLTIGADGTIFVPVVAGLYALSDDGNSASVKWQFQAGGEFQLASWSPAIASDGTIYLASTGLYALNPDGTEKWEFSMGGAEVGGSPAVGPDGTIYVGSNDTNLYAINPDGSEKWTFATATATESAPAIGADGTIYFGCVVNLCALTDGGQGDVTEDWSVQVGSLGFSAPAIGADGTIYVGANSVGPTGALWAINPDGSIRWKFVGRGGFADFSPVIGPDGTIYTTSGNYDGRGMLNLYAVGRKAIRRRR
jgi:outer membrane protein assembly factor BamB